MAQCKAEDDAITLGSIRMRLAKEAETMFGPEIAEHGVDEETMDLDTLKKQVETIGLVIKPQTADRRGYAARAAMRVYARLMEGEDPEEADLWIALASHYDRVVEDEKGK